MSKVRRSIKQEGSIGKGHEILISDHEISQIDEINSSGLMSGGGIRGKRKSVVGKYPSRLSNQTNLAPLSQNTSSDNNDDIDYVPVNGR